MQRVGLQPHEHRPEDGRLAIRRKFVPPARMAMPRVLGRAGTHRSRAWRGAGDRAAELIPGQRGYGFSPIRSRIAFHRRCLAVTGRTMEARQARPGRGVVALLR